MFALDAQALGGAAARIDAVVASLGCLDVAGPFGAAAAALPGAATRAACEWTATGLDAAVDTWAAHLLDLCETARRVARDAVDTAAVVADDLGTVVR